jgi:hypothetical protein
MATTTPNFGWAVPTSTDLVKDGAVAIETLGDSIDASLVDLKGGTTGQVLAKASNTDMDFSWVAQDDSNAIQNAIVDAKGDLIAATANDTPARLAVGSNFAFLQADSAESTGIKWNLDAFTSYTPTLGSTGGTLTSASATGSYLRIGKVCVTKISITITTAGTAQGNVLTVTMPFTSKNDGAGNQYVIGALRENALTGKTGVVRVENNSTTAYLATYDNTDGFIRDGYKFQFVAVYEVA